MTTLTSLMSITRSLHKQGDLQVIRTQESYITYDQIFMGTYIPLILWSSIEVEAVN